MVYKYKNNKWSRMLAARKLAAANLANAAAEQKAAEAPAAAAQCDVSDVAAPAAAQIPSTNSKKAEIGAEKKTPPYLENATVLLSTRDNATQPDTSLDASGAPEPTAAAEVCFVLVDSSTLPQVVDAFFVPSAQRTEMPIADAAAAAPFPSRFVGYVLRSRDVNTNGAEAAESAALLRACGVCDVQRGGGCLQVVQWRARRTVPTNDETSALTEGNNEEGETSPAESDEEVVMYVDAHGRCFMLSPSSVVSVTAVKNDEPEKAPEERNEESGGVAREQEHSVDEAEGEHAYWLIPRMLKDHFLALLKAQQLVKQKAALLAQPQHQSQQSSCDAGASTPTQAAFHVTPHPSLWCAPLSQDAAAPTAGRTQGPELTENACMVPPRTTADDGKKTAKKSKKKNGKAQKRSRDVTPPQEKAGSSATPAVDPERVVGCRIPYVTSVVLRKVAGDDTPALSLSGTNAENDSLLLSSVFCVGNCLAPYPADYVFSE